LYRRGSATQEDDIVGSERHIKDVAKKHDHKAEEKRRVDRKLDEALEESFRAPTPYRSARPSRAGATRTLPDLFRLPGV
jgi:hypothetical protein